MSEQLESVLHQCQPHLETPELYAAIARNVVADLVDRYREPWRKHHTTAHLGDVLGFLVENVGKLENPRPTLWAAIGHDSVYIPQLIIPGANEELSAQLTESRLRPYLPGGETGLIGHYIRKTADHEWDGEDMDLAYLLDADMKILGAPPDEFEEYDANIREEYGFAKPEEYDPVRKRVLSDFYDQDRLFITDVAHSMFEDQAKANLEARLSRF